jgi:hypothetical protein
LDTAAHGATLLILENVLAAPSDLVLGFFRIDEGNDSPLRTETVNVRLAAFDQCFICDILHQFIKWGARVVNSSFVKIFDASYIQALVAGRTTSAHFRPLE